MAVMAALADMVALPSASVHRGPMVRAVMAALAGLAVMAAMVLMVML